MGSVGSDGGSLPRFPVLRGGTGLGKGTQRVTDEGPGRLSLGGQWKPQMCSVAVAALSRGGTLAKGRAKPWAQGLS